jgi:hypothetical protein
MKNNKLLKKEMNRRDLLKYAGTGVAAGILSGAVGFMILKNYICR